MVMDDDAILPYNYCMVYYESAFDNRRFHPLVIMRRAEYRVIEKDGRDSKPL